MPTLKKFKTIYFWFLAFLFISCNIGSSDNLFKQKFRLNGTDLKINQYLGRTASIIFNRGHLIFRDDQPETKFTIINLNDIDNPVYVGVAGQGPGELANAGRTIFDSTGFLAYDLGKRRLFEFDLDSVSYEDYKPHPIFQSKKDGIFNIIKLNDNAYLTGGLLSKKQFELTDNQGNVYYEGIDYEAKLKENEPEYIRAQGYLSSWYKHPIKPLIVSGTIYGGILTVYKIDAENPEIEEVNRFQTFLPEYESKNINESPNFRPSEKTRWGYLSLSSNEKYIFALFSGRPQKRGVKFNAGNTIQVFDWKCSPLYELELDRDVLSITVDKSQLYALHESSEGFEVAKYDIPFN